MRESVRDKLRAINVVKVRGDISYKEAYPHEVVEDLELDYDLVWQITEELKAEKMLEVIE